MDYMSAREAADKWGISQRRVAVLCSENRINNAQMVGNMWIIPTIAEKPIDARITRYSQSDGKKVKPFLKWAGGKGQLLPDIERYYPFGDGKITKYAEPFVGGGAVLFDILNKHNLEEVYISDINAELINTYRIIREDVDGIVSLLQMMQNVFIPMDTEDRKKFYMAKRERFNVLKSENQGSVNIEKAALMIFLNKTCFNGLFRVNKKGLFNVPMGAYKNPMICDEENLRAVSEKLQNVKIVCGDYRESADFIGADTLSTSILHTVLSQKLQALRRIRKIASMTKNRLRLQNLLMICTEKAPKSWSAIRILRILTWKTIFSTTFIRPLKSSVLGLPA